MTGAAATRSFYTRWAGVYDRLARAPGVRAWRRQAVDALSLSPGDTVVEMGVGTGANLPLLREHVGPSGQVIGIDLTRGVLERAAGRTGGNGWSNVHVVQADATAAPIAGDVDAVLATFVVGMLADPDRTVTDWLDLLAPGGRVALLHAARSPYRLCAPLNLAFRGFVRLAAPDQTPGQSPTSRLEARRVAGTQALVTRTAVHGRRQLAGGFLRLAWGRTTAE